MRNNYHTSMGAWSLQEHTSIDDSTCEGGDKCMLEHNRENITNKDTSHIPKAQKAACKVFKVSIFGRLM